MVLELPLLKGVKPENQRRTGWGLFVVILGATLLLIGADLRELESFDDAQTPQFIGDSLIAIGTVIGAFFGGMAARAPK